MPPSDNEQSVYLDRFLLARLLLNHGYSLKAFASDAGLAYNTLRSATLETGIQPSTAATIARRLNCTVTDLLSPRDPRYVAPSQPLGPLAGESEWETLAYLDQGRLASNGLYSIVCRMRHRHTANRFARGKYYHLSWLPTARVAEMKHLLSRHADVCVRVGASPQISVNLTSTPVGSDGWWVIDEWVGERTLASFDAAHPLPSEALPKLLLEIASGLQRLHDAGVIFRELAPIRVLLRDRDNSAVLTDFELARLTDGSPSVSSDWPEDPFRAPEVEDGRATVRSDLYSYGRLVAATVGDRDVSYDDAGILFAKAGIPKRLAKYLQDCLHPLQGKRMRELAPLIKELSRWAGK